MNNKTTIKDDFNLDKIIQSGQCFRPAKLSDGSFRFITKEHVLYIKPLFGNEYRISCSKDEWERIWRVYFDLDTSYSDIRKNIPLDDTYMKKAADAGKGIRILNQDPFEMLISFIISQRKSIPAIRTSVEKICALYGKSLSTEKEDIYLFPQASDISSKGYEALSQCSLGYRLPYITATVENICRGDLNLKALSGLDDDLLLRTLMELKGVGIKVASCVALFAYGRGSIAPVDVWINRVIDEHYNGNSPFSGYGKNSGIFQQYAFYSASILK